MGRSTEVSWQVLLDEDEWSADEALASATPDTRPAAPDRGWQWRRWLSLGLVFALLLLQLGWALLSGTKASPATGRAEGDANSAAVVVDRLYGWESVYFVIAYRQDERTAVADTARLLDARYGHLHRALGLAAEVEGQKVLVQVEGVGLEDREAFVCSGLGAQVDGLVAQALSPEGSAGSWQVTPGFVLGMRGWARGQVCPEEAAAQKRLFAERSGPGLPRLAELQPALYNYPYRGQSPQQIERDGLAFVALIGYAVTRYGEGRLPLLLAAVQQPATWEEWIPAVFDVSQEEFEAGWREWLDEEYGM